MIDFDRFKLRFRQFGGWRLVWQYARMGVLWTGVCALIRCAIHGKSLKAAYPTITQKVDDILIARYRHILDENKARGAQGYFCENDEEFCQMVPKIIWFSWLQGMDNAPEIVKACLASQKKHLSDYDFRIVDLDNYRQWVDLPEYVIRKYRKGLIPPASFSDLLRLSLLKKYGGIWMDASVYCSGFGNDKLRERWDRIMGSELTVFRYFKRGHREASALSTWFFAAVPNHIVISSVLDMLLAYWKDYDCLLDYYVIHLFLGLALREFPEVVAKMPRENSYHSILLGNALRHTYREEDWMDLIEHVSIHKLNYRKAEEALKNENGYYWYILENRK